MSCCGSKRAAMRNGGTSEATGTAAAYSTGALEFEYDGSGELQVVGPMTGAIYTFSGSGSRAVVQAADAPSVAMNPSLRPIH
jgi:hypothetical protein